MSKIKVTKSVKTDELSIVLPGNSAQRHIIIYTRAFVVMDHVILNRGQMPWTAHELAAPRLTTTPHQREDVSSLERFNVHRCPTRMVYSATMATSKRVKSGFRDKAYSSG
ncbi:uncharacterized protein TNCV_4857721 [Trichonephila clavipes]|nr:uncharacterized protein TNCV_4857721 [Trichonephila clavipes]